MYTCHKSTMLIVQCLDEVLYFFFVLIFNEASPHIPVLSGASVILEILVRGKAVQ